LAQGKIGESKATVFNLKLDGNKLHRTRNVDMGGKSVLSEQIWQKAERKGG